MVGSTPARDPMARGVPWTLRCVAATGVVSRGRQALAVLGALLLGGGALRLLVISLSYMRVALRRRRHWQAKTPLSRFAADVAKAKLNTLEDAKRLLASFLLRAQCSNISGESEPSNTTVGGPVGREADRPVHLAIFPGSFNPPSHVHVEIAKRVCELPGIDGIWLDMAVHVDKKMYARRVEADRMRMTELAVAHLPTVGVTRLQAQMGEKGFGTEYFDMLRALVARAGPPGGPRPRISWVMGTDVVMGMRWWQANARILLRRCDQIVVFCRRQAAEEALAVLEGVLGEPRDAVEASGLAITILTFDDKGFEDISSSMIRRYLVLLLNLVPLEVVRYIVNHRHMTDFYMSLYNEEAVRYIMRDATTTLTRLHSEPDIPALKKLKPAQ